MKTREILRTLFAFLPYESEDEIQLCICMQRSFKFSRNHFFFFRSFRVSLCLLCSSNLCTYLILIRPCFAHGYGNKTANIKKIILQVPKLFVIENGRSDAVDFPTKRHRQTLKCSPSTYLFRCII